MKNIPPIVFLNLIIFIFNMYILIRIKTLDSHYKKITDLILKGLKYNSEFIECIKSVSLNDEQKKQIQEKIIKDGFL